MLPEIRRLSTGQFASLLSTEAPRLTRKIAAVHLHHTWRPTRSQFKGLATIEAMRNFHVHTNGWNDIAQHLTIDPQGMVWTGRNWNLPPASQSGRNGTRQQGPFMIEIVGDFDTGRDLLDGPQRQAVVDVSAALLDVCGLTTAAVMFHRELGSPKTCPGTGVDKPALLREIQTALTARRGGRAAPRGKTAKGRRKPAAAAARLEEGLELPLSREFLLGGAAAEPEAGVIGFESWEVQENDVAAQAIEDEARARVRVSLGEPRDAAAALARTRPEWQALRPYVVNLSQGRLSQGGEFDMPAGAIDGIVDAIAQFAQTTANPRVMMHAHGGLVGEKSALAYALTAHKWWLQHGVFPLYFIWETSAFEVLKNRLGLGRAVGDWWDRRFEAFARPIAKPLWSDMKEYALLSSSADAGGGEAGGARIFAQALAPLIKNPPGGKAISLHAVGHSAGTIFHSHFVPALLDAGLKVESLAFLAAAVRIDLFKQMLLPRITAGDVRRFAMFGMDAEAERDDDCVAPLGVPVYGKSLLYLVSGAFEPEQDAAILGLEDRFRNDPGVMALFPPRGAHRLELSHARGKPHNPVTKARKHGCFDNDDATMRSVFQTITGAVTHVPFAVKDPDCEKASSRASAVVAAPGYFPGVPSPATRPGTGADAGGGRRRALCVGIDSYPTSPLAGCVRDAQTWAAALRTLQFEVTTVLDTDATRQRVLDAVTALVEGARPGETIVFQYSGHGTQADDVNGDESDRYDEAMVPIDYQSGALLLDDDLADVYRRLPGGAVLTLFMDCCHSGTNSRFAPIDRSAARGSERRRFLQLSAELQAAHRQFRERAGSPVPTTPEESLPGVIHFAACLDNQFAYESSGQGHFTGIAAAQIAAAVAGSVTNESFMNDVAAKVIALGRPQTPRLMRLPADLTGRVLLGATPAAAGAPDPLAAPGPSLTDRAFDEWCLQFFEDGAARWRQRLGR
jgi:hypothetical protein